MWRVTVTIARLNFDENVPRASGTGLGSIGGVTIGVVCDNLLVCV
jgi:hypothetical protein